MKLFSTLFAAMLVGAVAPAYSQVAFQEDFEGVTKPALPTDWQTKTTDANGTGWQTHSGNVTFPGTNTDWEIPAKTNVALLNDWAGSTADTNNPARLITPLIDMSALSRPYFFMEYYYVFARAGASNVEALTLDASIDTGKTWTTVKTITAGNPYQWQDLFVDLATYKGEDGIMFSVTYSDKNARLIGAGVDNIKIFDPAQKDVKVITGTPLPGAFSAYGLPASKQKLGTIVFNNGTDAITSVTINYQDGANPVVSDVISGLNIAPFTRDTIESSKLYDLPSTHGKYNIKLWVELTGDVDVTNDSGNTDVTSVHFMPKKVILAEEGTGTWCGYCPRGHVFMDSVAASPIASAFSLVAVHNADPMVVPAYDAKLGSLIGGYPSMAIDRRVIVDPDELFDVYAKEKDVFGFAEITLAEVPVPGFAYSVKATVKPALELGGDYRLALAITEDDVTGTDTAWAQANYYSYEYNGGSPLVGAGLNWQQESRVVAASKMHYNHVARGIFPSADGAQGSLPNMMMPNTSYDYTFNITMEPWWHRYYSMHAVVMLIRASDGVVLNTANVKVSVGVSDVQAGVNELTIFPNPATNKAYINFNLAKASDVNVVVTDMMGRTVQSLNKENFSTGAHKINVDLSAVAAGVYNVTLQTEGGSVTTRLSVVK